MYQESSAYSSWSNRSHYYGCLLQGEPTLLEKLWDPFNHGEGASCSVTDAAVLVSVDQILLGRHTTWNVDIFQDNCSNETDKHTNSANFGDNNKQWSIWTKTALYFKNEIMEVLSKIRNEVMLKGHEGRRSVGLRNSVLLKPHSDFYLALCHRVLHDLSALNQTHNFLMKD